MISSLIVVVVIVAVACFLCSRDHHSLFLQPGLHSRQRQPCKLIEAQISHKSAFGRSIPCLLFFPSPFHHLPLLSRTAASSENKVPFQQQEMSILKELVRSSSVTMDSHADSVMVNGAHHSEEQQYSCLNGLTGEPASLPNSDHLNHHHLL